MTRVTDIIDVHSHAILPIGQGAPLARQPDWSVEGALAFMDAHGVAACVLSVPDSANHATGQAACDIARRTNEALAAIVAKHPARFGAMATLPGRDPDGAVAEIAHALDVLGLDGVATSTSIDDRYLGEPEFDPWLAELNRRGATLFVHPTVTRASLPLALGLNVSVIEFMFDTTRMLTNLLVTGARRRFPDIAVVTTHGGGTIPYLVTRIGTLQHTFGVGPGRIELSAEEVRAGFASFHYDVTAATSPAQLGALLDLVPASQLLMGLDYPFMPASSFAPAIAALDACPRLDAADLAAIAHGNAARLYPTLAARMSRAPAASSVA